MLRMHCWVVLTLTLILTPTLTPNQGQGAAEPSPDESDGGASDEQEEEEAEGVEEEVEEGCHQDVPCTPGLHVRQSQQDLRCGQLLNPEVASSQPDMTLELHHEVSDADGMTMTVDDTTEDPEKVLLIMVDPDAPSATECPQDYWLHWLALGELKNKEITTTEDIVEYRGPSPPPESGIHRYQLLVFSVEGREEQTSHLMAMPRKGFDLLDFQSKVHLDPPLGTFQFRAEM